MAAYRALGHRKDSLFELLEAALEGGPETLVRLSLVEVFRRGWASPSDALSDGRLSEPKIRRLLGRQAVEVAAERARRGRSGRSTARPGRARTRRRVRSGRGGTSRARTSRSSTWWATGSTGG